MSKIFLAYHKINKNFSFVKEECPRCMDQGKCALLGGRLLSS